MTYAIGNKVVFITGATGGIGTATAKALHARGAKLVLTGRRHEVLDALVHDLGGSRTLAMSADVADRDALDAVVAAAVERFGGHGPRCSSSAGQHIRPIGLTRPASRALEPGNHRRPRSDACGLVPETP